MENAPYDPAQIEAGRLLFSGNIDFVLGAREMSQIPTGNIPEVAFAGRSNVGKSSLLNALTGRKQLARTSHTPGRTREVNFFNVTGRLMLADLPGYGYAKAPKAEIHGWTRLIEDYLRGRVQLRRCCLLIDSRHGLKDTDLTAMAMMDQAAQNYQVVLTKCDKVKPGPLQMLVDETHKVLAKHPAAHPEIFRTSAHDTIGIAQLRAALASLAEAP
ncbi:MAG: ribosome biogenesis GTP-binding protein YihA/YsxC [Rhodospirillales bacterium]|nr:ribosome biogenesis GTP-binding protein YihA/YsxC [Rhodospirillales bacterium]